MTTWPEPPNSKSSVNRAGRAIAEGRATPEEMSVVDQWRAAHGYVINTFQIFFKRRIAKFSGQIEFVQRLKRRQTVFNKLQRRHPDGRFLMGDVTSMHDFAGCRLIFNDIDDLQSFRDVIHDKSSFENVEHRFKYNKDKYDYITHPKPTGYRGIHDVLIHKPRAHRTIGVNSQPWHGLFAEVQYRTRFQNAWATAVEISDLIDSQNTKFNLETDERTEFFAIASEIIARVYEDRCQAFITKSTRQLCDRFKELEDELEILQRLDLLRRYQPTKKFKRHNVMRVFKDYAGDLQYEIYPFTNAAKAIECATELEIDMHTINAVYVRADNPAQILNSYRNYFNDPVAFVDLIKRAM